MNKLITIIKKTYTHQVKSWTFLLFIILPFLIIAILGTIGYFSEKSTDSSFERTKPIAIVSRSKNEKNFFINNSQGVIKQSIPNRSKAQKKLKKKLISGYLVITHSNYHLHIKLYSDYSLAQNDKARILNLINIYQKNINISRSGISKKQLKLLSISPRFDQIIYQRDTVEKKEAKLISYMVIVFLVYLILLAYSSITAQEVASEKGNKIIEIIFSSTTPQTYFYGKIIGIVLIMFTQFLIYAFGGSIILEIIKIFSIKLPLLSENNFIFTTVMKNILNTNIIFVVLGIVIYIILSAFSGALISNNENISKASQLPILLCMFACLMTVPFINKLNSMVVKIFSFIPFFSNFFMPMRIINHSASIVDIIVSITILILTIIFLLFCISQMYGGLMLQTDSGNLYQRFKHGQFYLKH